MDSGRGTRADPEPYPGRLTAADWTSVMRAASACFKRVRIGQEATRCLRRHGWLRPRALTIRGYKNRHDVPDVWVRARGVFRSSHRRLDSPGAAV
jgi:hypothetical protein